jgi:hypothetical protein
MTDKPNVHSDDQDSTGNSEALDEVQLSEADVENIAGGADASSPGSYGYMMI